MLSNQILSLSVAVFCLMHVKVALSCSCPWRPTDVTFCESDYAIHATVLSETQTLGQDTATDSWLDSYNTAVEYTYEITIEYVYRSKPWYESAAKRVVITGISGCIMRLQPGATYLLMGYINYYASNGIPSLGVSCDGAHQTSLEYLENLRNDSPQCS